jgi:hypothetical protein
LPRGFVVLSVLLLAALSLGARCLRTETNIQAIERLQPEGAAMRARLAEIADALPAAGDLEEMPKSALLSPPIELDFRTRSYNTEVLMETQLRDPDAEVAHDLLLSPQLVHCLRWTGPKNPLEQNAWNDRGPIGDDCERAFAVRWLIVVRTVAYDLPEKISLEVFVADLPDRAIRFAFPIVLEGSFKKADIGRDRFAEDAMTELRSDSWAVARCTLAARLRTLSAARIELAEKPGAIDPCASPPATFREVQGSQEPPARRKR